MAQGGFTLERVTGGLGPKPVAVDECGDIILVCYADTSIARFARASESLLPVTVAGPSGRPLAPPRSKRPPRWSKTHIYERVTSKPVSDIIALADFGVVLALHSGLVTVLDASQQQAMIDRGAIDGSKGTHAIAFVPESSLLACCKGRSIALFRCTHPPHDDPATPDDAAPEIEPAPGPIRSPMFGENIRHELAMRTPIGPAHFKAVHTVDIGEWVYGAGFASGDVLLACLKRDVARVRLPASSSDDHTAAPEVSRLSVADYALPKRPARAVSRTPGGGALVVSGTRIVVFNADGVPSRVQVETSKPVYFACVRGPFIIVVGKDVVEVRHSTAQNGFNLAQTVPLQRQSGVSLGGVASRSLTLLSEDDHGITQLRMVPLRLQIERLAAVGEFEAAKTLCDQMMASGDSDEGAEEMARALELLLGFKLWFSDEKEDIGRSLVLSLRPCCGPMAPRLAAPSAPRLPIKLPIEMNEPLRLALACRGDHQTALHHMLMASPEDPRPFLCLLPSTMPHAVHPTILEHVVSAVDAQLMGIALVHEALRKHNSIVDKTSRANSLDHHHPQGVSPGSSNPEASAERSHLSRSISLAVPPRTPPRARGPQGHAPSSARPSVSEAPPSHLPHATPQRRTGRTSAGEGHPSPNRSGSVAESRGKAARCRRGGGGHFGDEVEADLLAWEEGMEKNKRSEVLGLVLPYLYTYRAKLGCDELSGGAMDAKIRELAGTHAMRVREGRAGKGGDGSAWDAEEGTSSPWGSSSEDGSLVPEDDRTAQWLAGTREGWGVLVDTALLKVLTESAGAVSGAGALGDFCRGPQIAHPAEAFEFLCRRRLAARLLDVLRFAGLHRPALEALHVLATLPDVSARQACVDGDPGPDAGREGAEDDGVPAWDVAGRCAVDAAVEYCCSTPDLARALVEEVCDWVLDVSEEAGLQILLGTSPPIPPGEAIALLEHLGHAQTRAALLDRAIDCGLADQRDWGDTLAALYLELLSSRRGDDPGEASEGGEGGRGQTLKDGDGNRAERDGGGGGREARGSTHAREGHGSSDSVGALGRDRYAHAYGRLLEILATWDVDVSALLPHIPADALPEHRAVALLRTARCEEALRDLVACGMEAAAEAWCDTFSVIARYGGAPEGFNPTWETAAARWRCRGAARDVADDAEGGEGDRYQRGEGGAGGATRAGREKEGGIDGDGDDTHEALVVGDPLSPPFWMHGGDPQGGSPPPLHLMLLRVHLDRVRGSSDAEVRASALRTCKSLMSRRARLMDPRAVLEALPEDIELRELGGVLEEVLEALEKDWRVGMVQRALAKSEGLEAREELAAAEGAAVRVTMERACWVCNKRLGGGAFAAMPDGRVVHLMCFSSLGGSGATQVSGWGTLD